MLTFKLYVVRNARHTTMLQNGKNEKKKKLKSQHHTYICRCTPCRHADTRNCPRLAVETLAAYDVTSSMYSGLLSWQSIAQCEMVQQMSILTEKCVSKILILKP